MALSRQSGYLFALCSMVASAQPAFDVASIKPSQLARAGGEGSRRAHVTVSPTSVILANVDLNDCIQRAYDVRFDQISGPDWTIQDRYDIIAKTEQPASKERLRIMLQALLAERFQLRLHRETRMILVYELITRKNVAKLPPSKPDSYQEGSLRVADGSFVFEHVTMPEFAARLTDLAGIDRPVLDKTGMAGVYDVTLKSAARAMLEDPRSIFSAIEDVGFKLEPRKGPVEMLVIDHAEKPSPN